MLIPIRSVSDDIDNNGLLARVFLLAIIPDDTFFSLLALLVELSATK